MTNKERLENIKMHETALKYQDRDNGDWFIQIDYDSFKFLREQAERVEKLEGELANNQRAFLKMESKIKEDNLSLNRENKRYREAIEKAMHETYENFDALWIIETLEKALEVIE